MTGSDPQPLEARILGAARSVFAARGYSQATVASIAAAAGVAPGVVKSLYDNKDRLFAAAMRLPKDPGAAVPEMIAQGLDGMGERLVRLTFALVSDPASLRDVRGIVKAGQTLGSAAGLSSDSEKQIRGLIEFTQSNVVDRLLAAVGIPDVRMRGALITAYLSGAAAARYVAKVEPLASIPEDEAVALIAPTIQTLLDPTSPLPGRRP